MRDASDSLEVSLYYIIGEGQLANYDKEVIKRIEELELLEEDKKQTLFDLIDTYIRGAKTRQAYS